MSKGNMFLGFARGKVGDVVFTRADGEQVTRVRNRNPKNPKTCRQGVQRSILKTISQMYSVLSPICDHSFEGYSQGTPNQSRFSQLNIDMLRTRVLENVNLKDDNDILAATITNYSPALISLPVINDYQVSEGSLNVMAYRLTSHHPELKATGLTGNSTYQEFVDALGIERGDQLTFLWLYGNEDDDNMAGLVTGFEYSRVVMEPSSGDMSAKFLSGKDVNMPNAANIGRLYLDFGESGWLTYDPGAGAPSSGDKVCIATAVILSRHFGASWRRSKQNLVVYVNPTTTLQAWPLGDAVNSFLAPETSSSLYLNQAENF